MEENQRQLVSDAIDYKGNPADRTAFGGWVTATLILVQTTSSNISTNLAGTSYMLCLLGGILADTFLTRYRTIAIFAVVNAMGTCLLAVSTGLPKLRPPPCNPAQSNECVEANSLQMGVYTFALYLHGIGLGGIKSSVSGFGTDQFDKNDEKENLQMATFFNVFYLIINIGTLLAVTVLVYIQDKVGRSWVQEVSSRSVAPSTRSPALSSPIGSSLAGLHGAHEPSPLTGDTVGSSPASFNAMVGAALAERKRLSVAKTSSRTTALILPVTGFLLLPQFILVGIGDAFIYAGQLDFFITESPRGMKAIGTGLFLATISLGSMMADSTYFTDF
ncbi:hypothetical protein GOBAR_AA26994 [Gossypium barbadense]|uniref:Major facilitator superfamily (MFS) profile domain-containing protein n=1 Tax=Gossypium barbadense TaxID=3634 RepID=A0A2P5WRF1_GOSBA|nr:hypothetical protein GOBAR_AA26994 [Gossypium barbadense]